MEVKKVIENLTGTYQLIVYLIYDCGLCVVEMNKGRVASPLDM